MGTKAYASVSVSRLLGDKPNPMEAIVQQVVLHDSDLVGLLLNSNINGMSNKVDRYYDYAISDYTQGLPGGDTVYGAIPLDALQTVIEGEEGAPITLTAARINPVVEDAEVIAYMTSLFQYGSFGSPTVMNFPPDSFPTARARGLTRGSLDSYETEGLTVILHMSYDYTRPIVTSQNIDGDRTYGDITTREYESSSFSFPLTDNSLVYLDITYYVDSAPGTIIDWVYLLGTNLEPTLEPRVEAELTTPYLPLVAVRTNGVTIKDNGTDLYKTSAGMLKKLDINILDIADAIDTNPNIDLIEDAFVTFGAQIQSQHPQVREYLYHYFEGLGLSSTSGTNKTTFEAWVPDAFVIPPTTVINVTEVGYSNTIEFNYIDINNATENIGAVGTVTSVTTILAPTTWAFSYQRTAPHNNDRIITVVFRGSVEQSYITFKRQIDATTVRTVVVHGLTHTTLIMDRMQISRTLAQSQNSEDYGFNLPIVYALVSTTFSSAERNKFYYETLILAVTAVEYIYTKWYQRSIFAKILKVIAIVVFLMSAGAAVNVSSSLLAAAKLILASLLKGIALKYIFKLAADKLGGDFALIVAAVAMAAGLTMDDSFGTIGDMPWAEVLLKSSMALFGGIQEVTQDDMAALASEMEDFSKSAEERQEELQAAFDLLDNSGSIDPLMLVKAPLQHNFNEGPEAFYERTIHRTNPGVVSLDVIGNYVDNALLLPEFKPL